MAHPVPQQQTLPSAPVRGLVHQQYVGDDRQIRTERKAEDYKGHTLHTHIYHIPDTYVGSMMRSVRQEWLLDYQNSKLVLANIDLPEAYVRLFLEIASNSGDAVDASRRMGVDPGSIDVTMDRKTITVRNGGEPIPIEPKPELSTPTKCVTVIDYIFGTLLTSSNYDTRYIRIGCGRNGYGSKLVNIFSRKFRVRVGDPKRGQEHEALWEGNMTQQTVSKSTPGFVYTQVAFPDGRTGMGWTNAPGTPYTGPAYVEVSYEMDFARFGYTEHPDEAVALFARHLIDFGMTCKVPVSFNGKTFDIRSIRSYGELFFTPEECKTSIIHYEWDTPGRVAPPQVAALKGAARDKLILTCPKTLCDLEVELCVFDTPDKAICFSFVNGLLTREGGMHVEEAYKALSAEVLEIINNTVAGKKKKGKEDKKDDKKDARSVPHLTPRDVHPHMSLIINCRLKDPSFNSQSKTKLTGLKDAKGKDRTKIGINIKTEELSGITKWSLIERLFASLEAKLFKTLSKTDGKKKRMISLEKGEDANEAGGPRSADCILYLVEGKSASAYPKRRIDHTPGQKDLSGFYPLKGKPLNTTNATVIQLADNTEYTEIKKMVGLTEKTDYSLPEHKSQLRYGFIVGTADADSDGKHIVMLIINMLYNRFPSILKLNMFGYLVTPVVRLFRDKAKKQVVKRFYSPEAFNEWLTANPNHKYYVKYYKGLGTSRDSDIEDDMTTAPTVICVYDDTAPQSLNLAFQKEQADARKAWLQKWREAIHVEDVLGIPLSALVRCRNITSLINRELVDYSRDSLFRALPGKRDLLKKSQRQAAYFVLKHWNFGRSDKDSMKVARIASAAAQLTYYHHGEKSLMDTIIKMAQDFVGTNNLNLFAKEGQMGTRHDGGEDAADGRYSETNPEWWVKYVYSKELLEMVPKRLVEGEEAEPEWIPCDIPLGIINGQLGVGTAHSTFIPAHSPFDIIRWLVERNRGVAHPKPVTPWYSRFTGTITIATKKSKKAAAASPPGTGSAPPSAPVSRFVISTAASPPGTGSAPPSAPVSRFVISTASAPPPSTEEPAEESDEEEEIAGENPLPEGQEEPGEELAAHPADGRRKKGVSMVTLGNFRVTREYPDKRVDVEITELPIGRWTGPYRKWLEGLVAQKKLGEVWDGSKTDTVLFRLTGLNLEGQPVNHKTLKLQKSYGLSNMTLIDDQGYPFHFYTVDQMLEEYYQSMIELRWARIRKDIEEVKAEVVDLNYRKQFILLVLAGTVVVFRRRKPDIRIDMVANGVPGEYLEKVKLTEFTEEELTDIEKEITGAEEKLRNLEKNTPQQLWNVKLYEFYDALQKRGYK